MKSVSIAKLAQFAAMCVACAIVVTKIDPSFAQSTDRDNPTPLTTNILSMKGEKGGEARKIYYYKLTPKSGKIKITLDSECKTNSASVTIKVQNPDGETLNDLVGLPTGGNPHRKVKTIELPLNTPTILQISTWGFSPIYRIKIEGDWTELASASVPPAQGTVAPTPTKPESKPDTPVTTAPKPTTTPDPNTCKQGYVWREAMPNDVVCVTPKVRTRTRQENSLASLRREPNGGAYGADTCKQGFVWREATSADRVCVVPKIRAEAAEDNQQAGARRIVP